MKKIFIAAITIVSCASCGNYYKAISSSGPATASTIGDQQTQHKYFILQAGTYAASMNNVKISADGKNIECDLDTVPQYHALHLDKGVDGKMRYHKDNPENGKEAAILNEVHFYVNPATTFGPGHSSIPLAQVEKMEVLEKDRVRTRRSHTKAILITVGAVAVLVVGGAAASVAAFGFW